MRTGRPKTPLMLTTTERDTLLSWTRRHTSAQALAQRARMVLACGEGHSNHAVATHLRLSPPDRWSLASALR